MTRTATVEIDLDVGGGQWPADEVLRAAIVVALEGRAIWTPAGYLGRLFSRVVIDEARIAALDPAA